MCRRGGADVVRAGLERLLRQGVSRGIVGAGSGAKYCVHCDAGRPRGRPAEGMAHPSPRTMAGIAGEGMVYEPSDPPPSRGRGTTWVLGGWQLAD